MRARVHAPQLALHIHPLPCHLDHTRRSPELLQHELCEEIAFEGLALPHTLASTRQDELPEVVGPVGSPAALTPQASISTAIMARPRSRRDTGLLFRGLRVRGALVSGELRGKVRRGAGRGSLWAVALKRSAGGLQSQLAMASSALFYPQQRSIGLICSFRSWLRVVDSPRAHQVCGLRASAMCLSTVCALACSCGTATWAARWCTAAWR